MKASGLLSAFAPRPVDPVPPVPGQARAGRAAEGDEAFEVRRRQAIQPREPWQLTWGEYKAQQARTRFEEWLARGKKSRDPRNRIKKFRAWAGKHPSPAYQAYLDGDEIPVGAVPRFEAELARRTVDPSRARAEYMAMEKRMRAPSWGHPSSESYPGDFRRWLDAMRDRAGKKLSIPAAARRNWHLVERWLQKESARRAAADARLQGPPLATSLPVG